MINDVYLLILQGQGDIYAKVVDERTFNWITSDNKGQLDKDKDKSGWEDISCPIDIKKRIWDKLYNTDEYDNDFNKFQINITSGSYQNDRALQAPVIEINDEEGFFFQTIDAFNWIKNHNLNLKDTFEGGIY